MNSFDKIILNGTDLVVDSSDIEVIKKYASSDVTTNPSLILKNFNQFNVDEFISNLKLEDILVKIGLKISKHVNGLISTEVNPSLSYDTENTVRTARKIIKLYEENGLNRDRILIKIAATWEGIKAAEILEKEGIKCNMTLVLSFFQAVYCAKVGATLISPFVGRITDWYKNNGYDVKTIKRDFGVKNVLNINKYFEEMGYKTIVMAASFRSIDQIKALSGISKITVSPNLLEELKNDSSDINSLVPNFKFEEHLKNQIIDFSKEEFEKNSSDSKVVKEKLDEGINTFIKDTNKLMENLLKKKIKIEKSTSNH